MVSGHATSPVKGTETKDFMSENRFNHVASTRKAKPFETHFTFGANAE